MGKTAEYYVDKELVTQNLEKFKKFQPVVSDASLVYGSDISNLSEHNEQYTALLRAYVKDFEKNSKNKREKKEDIYKIAKVLLIGVPVFAFAYMFMALYFLAYNKISVLDTLPGLFTALTSLLGTFMVVPQMITKYLFNKKEEENLAKIIGQIQEYDKNIRGNMKS